MINEELENRYRQHVPKGEQEDRYALIRAKCLELAYLIEELTLKSKEQSTLLTNMDQVMYNANAAIARNE